MKIEKRMGYTARWLLAAVMAFGVSTAAMAAATGVAATKHNLGSTGTGPNTVSDTAEVCVFCHTPHAADVSQVGIPLWNKAFTPSGGYTTYSSSTMDGIGTGALGVVSIGSVSIACLSCHDGTQAMDNIRNAPGSGGYDATGGGAGGLPYTWALGGDLMTNAPTTLAMLGTDLSNDHPIGIQYCGGYVVGTGCKDTDFVTPATGTIGGATAFWVDTTATTGRQKNDMILYQRAFAASNGGSYPAGNYPSVECASCHDVHGGVAGTTFLRVSNAGSAVCLACHVK